MSNKMAYPSGLLATGKKAWDRIWDNNKFLDEDKDYFFAEQIAQGIDDIARMRRVLKRDGDLLWINNDTNLVTHPYIKQIEVVQKNVNNALSKLGFSPSDRASIGLLSVESADAITDFAKAFANLRDVRK